MSRSVRRDVQLARYTIFFDGAESERVAKIHRITAGEAVEVEAAGEAEGIFLRETPDRTWVLCLEPRKPRRFFSLAARLSPFLVVKTSLEPDVHFRGGVE